MILVCLFSLLEGNREVQHPKVLYPSTRLAPSMSVFSLTTKHPSYSNTEYNPHCENPTTYVSLLNSSSLASFWIHNSCVTGVILFCTWHYCLNHLCGPSPRREGLHGCHGYSQGYQYQSISACFHVFIDPVLMFFAWDTHMRLSVCQSNEPCLQIHLATRTDHDKRWDLCAVLPSTAWVHEDTTREQLPVHNGPLLPRVITQHDVGW